MNDELQAKLRALRLPRLAEHWDDDLQAAARQRMSHATLLTHVVDEEYRLKGDRSRQERLRRARLPEPWTMETFPFDRQPKLNRKAIFALYDTLDFLTKAQNIVWLGRTGCGKTGLASSFLVGAIQRGASGRYVLFADLVAELYQAVALHAQEQVLKKYQRWDLLLIDEIGYVEVEPAQVGLFFTLMQQRHRQKSTLLTSNLGFSEWSSFLKNDHLTAALIDRLTEASHVFNMKECVSLRGKLSADA
ncbi:MAG: ATP-binding protein [Verrucomicrobiales bacterium]|nr:ATP-binding protein [Verrucomicrobiales bacterium]